MNKFPYYFFTLIAFILCAMPAHGQSAFSYKKNVFIMYQDCLGIYAGTSLTQGERVWLFTKGEATQAAKVDHVIDTAIAKKRFDALGFDAVMKDQNLEREIGCTHAFRGGMPKSLARMSLTSGDRSYAGLAIRGLPAHALITINGGKIIAETIDTSKAYLDLIKHRPAKGCHADDSLIRVKQFWINEGRSIYQIDIGRVKKLSLKSRRLKIEQELKDRKSGYHEWAWPEIKKEVLAELDKKIYFESVEICQFFLDEAKLLKKVRISRKSGVDERVDTPTDLDNETWADTTQSTIGFISLDAGLHWDLLEINAGFEGIGYSIRQLNGSKVLFERGLYTHH